MQLKYLKSLSNQYPNIAAASTEIINLQAILNLPKGTEHFLTDIHGEYEQFNHYSGRNLMLFLLVMAAGMVTSLVLGAAIGTFCKTQMMATSITVPAMMVFAFLPMLAMFNDPIRRIAGFSYTQQMSLWLTGLGGMGKYDPHLEILLVDLAAAGALFAAGYKRSGLS